MKRRIPWEQALKLHEWRETFVEVQRIVRTAEQRLEVLRRRLVDAHDFADIPVEQPGGVDVKLEAGPDESGLVEVEWQEEKGNAS